MALAALLGALGQYLYKSGADAAAGTLLPYAVTARLVGGVVLQVGVTARLRPGVSGPALAGVAALLGGAFA